MSLTESQIRDRAANDLGLLRIGGILQTPDADRITQGYAEVYARLKSLGLATWAYADGVPDALAVPVIALVCQSCLGTYSVPVDRYNRITNAAGQDGLIAIRNIRELVSVDQTDQKEPEDY